MSNLAPSNLSRRKFIELSAVSTGAVLAKRALASCAGTGSRDWPVDLVGRIVGIRRVGDPAARYYAAYGD